MSTDQVTSGATYQTSQGLLQAVLRDALLDVVVSAHGVQAIGRVGFGACAGLYSLLAAHPVDRRGRCRSCRGPGWLGRRRQVCMVFQKAHYWLRQPAHRLQAHLASELGVDLPPLPDAADPEATEVLPRVEPDLSEPPTYPLQTPAIPPTPTARAGRPELDHGGAGEHPDSLRPRRGPSDNPSPGPGRSLLLTGL
ncbi:MAG: hypothetical protein ACT4NP_13630 [Pseudonocardiales bacterium]